jgi:hypothetical protein
MAKTFEEQKMARIENAKQMKKSFTTVSFILYGLSIWAILAWYDWKLILVLLAFVGANNLMIKANEL